MRLATRIAVFTFAAVFSSLVWTGAARAQAIQYERPVDTAPQEKSIGGGYKTPTVQKPLPRSAWLEVLDVVLLAAALSISVWIVLYRRNRRWVAALTTACV